MAREDNRSLDNVFDAYDQINKMELPAMKAVFGDRDVAMKNGVFIEGTRYEVHRHHPPLVYGRNMLGVEPEASSGWAVCRTDCGVAGQTLYTVITYEMPNISARIVPKLQAFSRDVMENKQG